MGFNSAFKGLKLLKIPGNGRLNNLNILNDPVLNVLIILIVIFMIRWFQFLSINLSPLTLDGLPLLSASNVYVP